MATLELYRDDTGLTEPPILEGQMSNSGIGPEVSGIGSGPGIDSFNTLDEPIRETIWRDVKAVGLKFKHVLIPVQKKSLLKVGFRLLFYGFLLCVVEIFGSYCMFQYLTPRCHYQSQHDFKTMLKSMRIFLENS